MHLYRFAPGLHGTCNMCAQPLDGAPGPHACPRQLLPAPCHSRPVHVHLHPTTHPRPATVHMAHAHWPDAPVPAPARYNPSRKIGPLSSSSPATTPHHTRVPVHQLAAPAPAPGHAPSPACAPGHADAPARYTNTLELASVSILSWLDMAWRTKAVSLMPEFCNPKGKIGQGTALRHQLGRQAGPTVCTRNVTYFHRECFLLYCKVRVSVPRDSATRRATLTLCSSTKPYAFERMTPIHPLRQQAAWRPTM